MRRLARLYNDIAEGISVVIVAANETIGSGCLWTVVAVGAAIGIALIWLVARLAG